MKSITLAEIQAMDRLYRANLVNNLSGFKSGNLIGSINEEKVSNLAVFSSVVHIGSEPPLLAMVTRPTSVPRHSYDNIKKTGFYTINHIHSGYYKEAHQCSAKYDRSRSEFKETGLSEQYIDGFHAPFVREAHLKMAMEFVEEIPLTINDTILIIGRVLSIHLPEDSIMDDGSIDLNMLDSIAVSGLDTYHKVEKLEKLKYARP